METTEELKTHGKPYWNIELEGRSGATAFAEKLRGTFLKTALSLVRCTQLLVENEPFLAAGNSALLGRPRRHREPRRNPRAQSLFAPQLVGGYSQAMGCRRLELGTGSCCKDRSLSFNGTAGDFT